MLHFSQAALKHPFCWTWLAVLLGALTLAGSPASAAADQTTAEPAELAARATPTPRPARPTPTPRPATPTPTPAAEPAPDMEVAETEPDSSAEPAARMYPVPDDQPADYPLPNGHFFSQAVPGATPGFGFTIADAAGIPFWTEYQRLGGLRKLGYPISRRFAWEDSIAQAVQGGVLRWRGGKRAELQPLESLGDLPFEAMQPEPPARLGSWAAHQPWSGWWWPATSSARGPYLFDSNGPLAKYDRFVAHHGDDDPRTLEWERTELRLYGISWAGHCNGWAAAALLENEPTDSREVAGITFSVADQKGLLSAYHFADAAAWLHGEEGALSPLDFHNALVDWLGNGKKGFIMTFRPSQDEEVWSYPSYRFELMMSADPLLPDVTHVKATVWLSDNDVPADFVGVRPWKGGGQTYEYQLHGPTDAPTGGEWERSSVGGGFAKPAIIWYPDPEHRNFERTLASPNLSYKTLEQILNRP